jgi:signal peptidase I
VAPWGALLRGALHPAAARSNERAQIIPSHGTSHRGTAPTTSPRRSLDLRVCDNIEAIAISIAMALVLKFFIIEAYQIPTGSMQPTILGDPATGIKDRVLADKLITMLRPPERWEVMIFRFPLDERRLYVKRIVGLPGETLQVLGGDIWIDNGIARKPDHVNESVLKHIAQSDGPMDVGRWFSTQGAVEVEGTSAIFRNAGTPRLKLRHPVVDDFLHGFDPDWGMAPMNSGDHVVPDLDVTLAARLNAESESLRIIFEDDAGNTVFVLPRTGSSETAHVMLPINGTLQRIPIETEDGEPPRALPIDTDVEILARVVDRRLLLIVDGEEWLRYDDDESGPRPQNPRRAGIAFEMPGGGRLSEITVQRDIFYLSSTRPSLASPPKKWEIPDDSYFGMGDNTQFSHDSRSWRTATYTLRDGRVITGFDFPGGGWGRQPADANPFAEQDGSLRFSDVHGDSIVFQRGDIVNESRHYEPFINQRFLLGKAGVVFWPVFDPFRWKLIR